jgi:Tfp pilus assembly protein PilF
MKDDPDSARVHASLAMVYLYQGRKELVPQEARKAIELDPNEREGYMMMAIYDQCSGEYEHGQAMLKTIVAADPLFVPARVNIGENLRQMGDPAGAIREQQRILDQDPKSMFGLTFIAMAYMTQGSVAKAREALVMARTLDPQNYQVRLLWALQLAIEGNRAEAYQAMDPEVLKYGELIIFTSYVAEFYAVLGERAKALEWLDRGVRAGDERADWFERDPLLANIRQEARFRQIVDGIRYRQERRRDTPR